MNRVGKIYWLSRILYLKKIPILPKVLWMINRILFACDIPFKADIDKSVVFSHNGLGVVVNPKSKIGKNSLILQQVTLGGNMGKKRNYNNKEITSPIVGEGVVIGAGAKILGPVIIGDFAKIGAGAIVLNDIPENAVAIGVPAKVLKN